MITQKIMLLAFISFFSTSCLGSLKEDDAPSKEEIKQRRETGDTKDYCETFDWYDDGECDSFCINADQDCTMNCDAVPVCPDGSIEVRMCEGHPACQELEACGTTLFCETCESEVEKIQWHSVASICPKDHFPLSTCDSVDMPCVEIESACGSPVYCNPIPVIECFAPLCEAGYIEVQRCKLDDADCKDVIVCAETGACIPDQVCAGRAECKADEIRYQSSEECEENGRPCRQNYFCNDIVWCGATENCELPTCGDKQSVLNCSDLQKCSEAFGCGQMAICEG